MNDKRTKQVKNFQRFFVNKHLIFLLIVFLLGKQSDINIEPYTRKHDCLKSASMTVNKYLMKTCKKHDIYQFTKFAPRTTSSIERSYLFALKNHGSHTYPPNVKNKCLNTTIIRLA